MLHLGAGPRWSSTNIALVALCCLAFSSVLRAQSPVTDHDARLVNLYLDEDSHAGERLKCAIKSQAPFLDFAFRFDIGYVVRCPVKEFGGKGTTVLAFVRITPEGGERVVLGEAYGLQGITEGSRAGTDLRKLRDELDFSGGFSAGEGRYAIDVLVVDKGSGRICRRTWKASVARKGAETKVPMAIDPHRAVPMTLFPWNKKFNSSNSGLRLTVLLDAAPIFPFSQKLRVWDRSFLLSTLSSVVDQIDCQSIRLVAFNLDQQKEIFRQDFLDHEGFIKLGQAMRGLELGKVSYEVLQRPQGPAELLARLTGGEKKNSEPSDIVILLGPHTRFIDKIP